MRIILTLLVLLGVFAGMHQAAVPGYTCEVLASLHAQEHSGHHHDLQKPCKPSHDQKCPVDQHHLRACCHGMPLAEPGDLVVRLGAPRFNLLRCRHHGEKAPDGPCLGEDKPPLI